MHYPFRCSYRWTVRLVMLFSICSFILGILTLHAGVPLAGRTWMPYAYILRYDYSTIPRPGTLPNPSSFAILHIMNVCTGPGIRDCYKSHRGELMGKTLRQDNIAMSFFLTSLTAEIGLGLQTLTTFYTILFRMGWLDLLIKWLVWWPIATPIRLCLPSFFAWASLLFSRFVVRLAGWKNALILRYVPWMTKITLSNVYVVRLALGSIGSTVASIATTTYIYKQTHAPGLQVTCSPLWLGILWGGLPFTVAALAMEIIESNIERACSVTDAVNLVKVKPKEISQSSLRLWSTTLTSTGGFQNDNA